MFGGFDNIFYNSIKNTVLRPNWQYKTLLPDGLNWLCYFAGSSKSHHENSVSFIFLESPQQVNMKNFVKSSKHFFGYFNTLETHNSLLFRRLILIAVFRICCNYSRLNRFRHIFVISFICIYSLMLFFSFKNKGKSVCRFVRNFKEHFFCFFEDGTVLIQTIVTK